jgi:hypothetical protein
LDGFIRDLFPGPWIPGPEKIRRCGLAGLHFIQGVDFSDFKPLASTSSFAVWGAAVGNKTTVIGWYRDATSEPPDWNLKPKISNQTVVLTVPGTAANWQIDFYNTKTGADIIASTAVNRTGKTITITLPEFTDDTAFKMYIHK